MFFAYIVLVISMEIKKGDLVTRNSYQNDTIFKVVNIKGDICYLKGVDVRLYADSSINDLVLLNKEFKVEEILSDVKIDEDNLLRNDEFFYLPGKVLHIDGDCILSNHNKIFIK